MDDFSYCSLSTCGSLSSHEEPEENASDFKPEHASEVFVSQENTAKRASWVAKVEEGINFDEHRDDDKFKHFMALCPYSPTSKSLVKRMYKIIATCSVKAISRFLGIIDCPVNESTQKTVDTYARDILTRGNAGGRSNDNFRTNENFLRRQAAFLEWMEHNETLKSGFEKLSCLAKRTKEELAEFTWRPRDDMKHSFVSEVAAIAYIESLDETKAKEHKKIFNGLKGIVNIEDLDLASKWEIGSEREVKRRKFQKYDFIRSSDLGSYRSALAEIQRNQAKLLNVNNIIEKLRDSDDFKVLTKTKLRIGKDREML